MKGVEGRDYEEEDCKLYELEGNVWTPAMRIVTFSVWTMKPITGAETFHLPE